MSINLSKSAFFEGVGHFERKLQTEGSVAYQPLLVSENYSDCRGINISAVHCLVLSQSTRVTDKQTDGGPDRQTDRITTPKTALALLLRAVKITKKNLNKNRRSQEIGKGQNSESPRKATKILKIVYKRVLLLKENVTNVDSLHLEHGAILNDMHLISDCFAFKFQLIWDFDRK